MIDGYTKPAQTYFYQKDIIGLLWCCCEGYCGEAIIDIMAVYYDGQPDNHDIFLWFILCFFWMIWVMMYNGVYLSSCI